MAIIDCKGSQRLHCTHITVRLPSAQLSGVGKTTTSVLPGQRLFPSARRKSLPGEIARTSRDYELDKNEIVIGPSAGNQRNPIDLRGCRSVVAVARNKSRNVDNWRAWNRRWHAVCQVPGALRGAAIIRALDGRAAAAVRRVRRYRRRRPPRRSNDWRNGSRCGGAGSRFNHGRWLALPEEVTSPPGSSPPEVPNR